MTQSNLDIETSVQAIASKHLENAAVHLQKAQHAIDAALQAVGPSAKVKDTRKLWTWRARLWKTQCALEGLCKWWQR